MDRKYIGVFVAVCIVIMLTTVFATADSSEKVVRTLIDRRTETLNLYYQGDMSREEATALIKEIESGNLMEKDLKNMEDYFQTDIERVKDYKISSVEITHEDEGMICADVSMQWKVENVEAIALDEEVTTAEGKREKIDAFLCKYSVICQKEGDAYKLVQFF